VEVANAERIALVARKLGGSSFTTEDQERLNLLTARVQELVPRVTEEDLEGVKAVERKLKELEQTVLQVQRRYRLGSTG
jgi:N-acetylmuramic acid 6-phosphate (MurNAc-6-P) etherase